VVIALLCLLNSLGVRKGSWTILFFSVVKLIPLTLLIIIGLVHFVAANAHTGNVAVAHDFGKAVLVLIFAYGGFEMATIPAGEMVNPRKSVAIGIIGTLIGVTIFYMLIQLAASWLDPTLSKSTAPLADAGKAMFIGGSTVMTIGAVLSIFGTKSGIALSSPRILYALSFNRTLPSVFAKVWPRFRTSVVAIWTTGILVMILATTGTFTHLILLNVAARLYEYFMVCLSVLILRYRLKDVNRSFKLPFGILIPLVAAVLCIWLLTREAGNQLLAALIALVVGLILYALGRATQRQEG
jgi:APA family basic amino acid/polyamine antiporter